MQSNNGYSYFLMGVGVGAAVGLLFAPKTGSDARNYLQSKAGDAGQLLKDQGEKAMDLANEGIGRAKGLLRDQAESVSQAVQAGKRAYKDAVEI